MVDSKEWQNILNITSSDFYGHTDFCQNDRGGFENEIFSINPYWWGEDNEKEENKANFIYKPTDFKIKWYKYPFRDSYMNQNLNIEQIKSIWRKCHESVNL